MNVLNLMVSNGNQVIFLSFAEGVIKVDPSGLNGRKGMYVCMYVNRYP